MEDHCFVRLLNVLIAKLIKNLRNLGTIIYMEISTSVDLDPNEIVDNRADIETEFNEPFIESEELESLW